MRTITALTLLLAFTGCGDDDGTTPPADSGTDTGMTTPDSGPDPEPDAGTDAGPVEPMPLGADNPPALGAQIDRMGRPAINTALNNPFNGDATARNAAKDAYNSDDTPSAWSATWSDDFQISLAILDSLDTVCGNQLGADGVAGDRYAFLAGVLADDQLYVNTASGTCGTYLGHEAEVLEIVEDGGCGGRTPNDDVIARSYSVLAAGALSGVDDTITEDDAEHDASTFPFLAAPE